ncbi:MAG TPA: ABC transporter permease [Acidimicrobiia bacterium]
MTRPVSHAAVIGSIVRKDVAEYGRDRLWAILTALVLVVVVVLFYLLPDDVEESISIGVSGLGTPALSGLTAAAEQGLAPVAFEGEGDLEAVVAGDAAAWLDGGRLVVGGSDVDPPEGAEEVAIDVGIAFPPDFVARTALGEQSMVTVYVDAAVPEEIETAVSSLVRELAFALSGEALPVTTPDPAETYVVLGADRVGDQTTARDTFRPVFVFLVLMMEMFVMSSLIAKEIQDRTVTAMLVTPATIADVLAAKGIAGTIMGFGQAVIILLAIGALADNALLMLVLILLGSVMVAGVAMLAGSVGKDFITTMFQGMVYMIPLLIPAFAAMFPGTASIWVRALPSYPLVKGLVDVSAYGAGWSDTLGELGTLLAWCVALFVLGWVVLKRKVQTI